MSNIKIYLAQINNTVGDINGNFNKIIKNIKIATENDCNLVIFPEMTISGYPAMDLWQKEYFINDCQDKIVEICKISKNTKCHIIVGCPTLEKINSKNIIRNSAIIIYDGKISKIIHKKTLPNYSVFDELRYFKPASIIDTKKFNDFYCNIFICEDAWDEKNIFLALQSEIDFSIIINSSPFEIGKYNLRISKCLNLVKKTKKPLIYLNQIGGQDSLIFDGASFIMNKDGTKIAHMASFSQDYAIINIDKTHQIDIVKSCVKKLEFNNYQENNLAAIYSSIILGVRDYVNKNGFEKILVGASGGIDSALVSLIAVDALGNGNVNLYALSTKYNSKESLIDAQKLSKNLGIILEEISIQEIFSLMQKSVENLSDIALQNLQSRIRGNILMSISNSNNSLLLSTGNKSEISCGYATLYGDMCGAYNPIKDIYKTQIYQLAKWRNSNIPEITLYKKLDIIPGNIIQKEPSAELKENQKDSDTLPDYEILDKILYQIIEQQQSIADICQIGYDKDLVEKIANLFYNSEYKRKQSVMGPKISKMSFDNERRYQITNKYKK